MKFYLVPVGEVFIFQGENFTKSGPLTASAEVDGKTRMIPRSANVQLLNVMEPDAEKQEKEKLISSTDALNAAKQYHQACMSELENIQKELTPQLYDKLLENINTAYQNFKNSIEVR